MTAKPKLSGAARRKIAREKAALEGADYIKPLPPLKPLDSPGAYRYELNIVYASMRAGDTPPDYATKAVYILNLGAALAKAEEEARELRELVRLREAELQDAGILPYATRDDYVDALPAPVVERSQ